MAVCCLVFAVGGVLSPARRGYVRSILVGVGVSFVVCIFFYFFFCSLLFVISPVCLSYVCMCVCVCVGERERVRFCVFLFKSKELIMYVMLCCVC